MFEFQVVGAPILDSQLADLKCMMLAVGVANGVLFLEHFVHSLHSFEKAQLSARALRLESSARKAAREHEERQEVWTNEQLQQQYAIETLERKFEQQHKELSSALQANEEMQSALEERTRQADNWKAMYESLKADGSLAVVSQARGQPSPHSSQALTHYRGGSSRSGRDDRSPMSASMQKRKLKGNDTDESRFVRQASPASNVPGSPRHYRAGHQHDDGYESDSGMNVRGGAQSTTRRFSRPAGSANSSLSRSGSFTLPPPAFSRTSLPSSSAGTPMRSPALFARRGPPASRSGGIPVSHAPGTGGFVRAPGAGALAGPHASHMRAGRSPRHANGGRDTHMRAMLSPVHSGGSGTSSRHFQSDMPSSVTSSSSSSSSSSPAMYGRSLHGGSSVLMQRGMI